MSTRVHAPDSISKKTKTDTQTAFAEVQVGCRELSETPSPPDWREAGGRLLRHLC